MKQSTPLLRQSIFGALSPPIGHFLNFVRHTETLAVKKMLYDEPRTKEKKNRFAKIDLSRKRHFALNSPMHSRFLFSKA